MTNTKPETLTPGDLVEFKLAPSKPMMVETVQEDGGIGLVWSNESGGPFRQTVRPERLRKIGRRHTDRPSAPPAAPAPTGIAAAIDVSFPYPTDPAPAPEPQHHTHYHAPADPSPSYSDPSPSPDYSSPDTGGGFDGGGGGDFGGGGSSGDW